MGQPNHYLSKIKELRGKDCTIETVLEVRGINICIMRENGIFSSDHKASEHAEGRSGPHEKGTIHHVAQL